MTPGELFNADIATRDGNIPYWQAVSWAYTYSMDAVAQIAALTEAVKVLAKSKGVDSDAVVKAVSKAVTAKLNKIKLDVKVS